MYRPTPRRDCAPPRAYSTMRAPARDPVGARLYFSKFRRSGKRVRITGCEAWHLEAGLHHAPFEHREVEFSQFGIVAGLESVAQTIVGESAPGRAEEIHCARQPFAQCRVDALRTELLGRIAQLARREQLVLLLLFENNLGCAGVRCEARILVVDADHQ